MQSPLPAEAATKVGPPSPSSEWPCMRVPDQSPCYCACPVVRWILSEIKHPLSLGITAQAKCFLLWSNSSITGWSKTECRLQRTWQRRWRCQTPRGHQTCTNAVYGHSYSRLCNGHHPNPHSGSVGQKGKVITSYFTPHLTLLVFIN